MNNFFAQWLILFVGYLGLFRIFIFYANHIKLVDIPNQRSLHQNTTARGGGLIFSLVWIFSLLLNSNAIELRKIVILMVCGFAISLLGIVDDIKGLSSRFRLIAQLIVALVLSFQIQDKSFFEVSWLWYFFSCFVLIWSINIFNFMDGADGIAAVQAISVISSTLIFSFGLPQYILLSNTTLVICLLAFFVWNFPKARIFMGDSGSGFLGLLIGYFICQHLVDGNLLQLSILMSIYSFFVVDSFFTLLRRILSDENWLEAHRSHAYQRLVWVKGWSHRQLLFSFIAYLFLMSIIALLISSAFMDPIFGVALSYTIAIMLYLIIDIKVPMYPKEPRVRHLKNEL